MFGEITAKQFFLALAAVNLLAANFGAWIMFANWLGGLCGSR